MKAAIIVLALASSVQAAPRVVVLPLPEQTVVDPDIARAFDARLLVALDATKRITTVTLDEELTCTTPKCLADAATANKAIGTITVSILKEPQGITMFATLIDANTAASSKRAELVRLTAGEIGTTAPTALARKLLGATAQPAVVGVLETGRQHGVAPALLARLSALQSFTVVAADRAGDSITHRASIALTKFEVAKNRHHVHDYFDGTLVGNLSILDLADNRVVFSKTVSVAVSRRVKKSTEAEIANALVESAVADWMTAFHAARIEPTLKGDQ